MSPTYTPLPRNSAFLAGLERVPRKGGLHRFRDDDYLYEYDPTHGGELEMYNRQGYHRGVADVMTGEVIKPSVKGRRIDV
ncbi:colicin E3/pyocin S6 family cytotoxin [Mycobacterium marinum]|uniref:colicin E3/pyocin S6 family cytotoxin n=1 Tax=Mycobacterium marinum TaxID=1781 RepID=UPI003B428467